MKKLENKILVVGDLHLKPRRGYADFIVDGRAAEEKAVLDFIVNESKDCDTVAFLGDQLNAKHNDSETLNKYVNFLERFDGKEIHILAGNHTKFADGRSAEDFLREVKGKNWHIVTAEPLKTLSGLVFCPYTYKSELGERDNATAAKKLLKLLPEGEILFVHHAISDTPNTEFFDEIVLDRKALEKKYGQIIAGHVHTPGGSIQEKTVIAGSVFTDEAGETEKFIYKIKINEPLGGGMVSKSLQRIALPGRPIYKIDSNHVAAGRLHLLRKDAIVKVTLTEKLSAKAMEELKAELRTFDAHVLLENYPTERRKAAVDKDILSISTEELLEIYAKQNKIDAKALLKGWQLIKTI